MVSTGPTLLVFTLGPGADAGRRHLLPGAAGGGAGGTIRAVFSTCLDAGLDAGRTSGMALRVAGPEGLRVPADVTLVEQVGPSFAERFRCALADAFTAGASPVVVVGTDSPGLGREQVAAALALLDGDPDRVVLGPARDGGFYLLGANRPLDGALAATRFCRRLTLRELRTALEMAGRSVVLLEPLADLDRRGDLERFAAGAQLFSGAYRRVALAVAAWFQSRLRPLSPAALGALLPSPVGVRAGRAPPAA